MSEILTTVGNYEITQADVEGFIASLPREQQAYAQIPQFQEQVKGKLIEMCLFAMLGEETNVTESPEYSAAMKSAKRDILGQIALNQMMEAITVTEEEARAYFDAHSAQFAAGPKAGAKHILVDSEEKALSVKAEIENQVKTFEQAAAEYSSCPSKQKGGDLGTFGRGQMVQEFDEAVFTGELNTILGPVQTQFGYHLIYVYARTESEALDYESVKDKAGQAALQEKQLQAYNAKLAELKAKYITE